MGTVALLAVSAFVAEASAPFMGAADSGVLLSFERTACYGTCPDYTVTVFQDGRLEYRGREFVKIGGRVRGRISRWDREALDAAFTKAAFCDLVGEYPSGPTDLPSVRIDWSACPGRSSVDHYLGDESAPAALVRLEGTVDAILRTERWIGTKAERAVQWGEVELPPRAQGME
jgi:hypothetical protein